MTSVDKSYVQGNFCLCAVMCTPLSTCREKTLATMPVVLTSHTASGTCCAVLTGFRVLTFCLCLFLPLFCSPSNAEPAIHVDANAAMDSNSSLEYYLCGVGSSRLESGTTLYLSPGTHTLGEGPFCLLQNLDNVTIQGEHHSLTVVDCLDSYQVRRGIAFFNITNLKISDVTITHCGREISSGLPGYLNDTFAYVGPQQKAVLIFTHCTDVVLANVTIHECYGFGVLAINVLGDTVLQALTVTSTNNPSRLPNCSQPIVNERSDLLCSGSGVTFLYADTSITQSLVEAEPNLTTSLHITDCYFFNNTMFLPPSRILEIFNIAGLGFRTEPVLLTGSGSLAVYVGQRKYFAKVKIKSTTMLNNTAEGGILLFHYNSIRNSKILLDDMLVHSNQAIRGGGLLILLLTFLDSLKSFPQYPSDVYDLVEISRSTFSGNHANFGGGIYMYATLQNISVVRVVIRDSKFIGNVARFGSALSSFQLQTSAINKATYILMEDVVAYENTYFDASEFTNSPENSGAFAFQTYNVTIIGTEEKGCLFHDNAISAIFARASNVFLHGNISFYNNRGFTGGAISMLDNSVLFIYDDSSLNFTGNSAFTEGGAIYTHAFGNAVTEVCAIQFLGEVRVGLEELSRLNFSITFSNNNAGTAGNSIYGNPLYNCFFLPSSAVSHVAPVGGAVAEKIVYDKFFQFLHTVDNGLAELNSVAEVICICQNHTSTHDYCNNSIYHHLDREIIPGQTFDIFLNPVDITGTPATSLLYAELVSYSDNLASFWDNPVSLGSNQDTRRVPGLRECSKVDFTIYAPENSEVHLKLFASVGGQESTVVINVTSCPPGFTLGGSEGRPECVCSDFIENRLMSSCNQTTYTVARPANHWLGTKEDNGTHTVLFVSTCPINYCREDVEDVDLTVPDQLCVPGRSGTLCGKCEDGLSSVIGPSECKKCSNAWLANILLVAVAGLFIVVIAFLLDLTITRGTMPGVLFYANIVSVNATIYFRGADRGFLYWTMSWLNLDPGFPVCLYDGMREGTKIAMQYIFPVYLVLIIVAITVLSQHSLFVQRIVSRLDGTHVLVTLFYLSFLKILRTVIDTGTFVTMVTEKGSFVIWFYDGTLRISDAVPIAVITISMLALVVFIIPYGIAIIFSTCIQRFAKSTRLNAYFDASLAPYKDKLRFWFGARLILVCILYFIIANRGTNNADITLTLQVSFLVGFAILQAFIQPFKSTAIAILDLSFFVNLILLSVGTAYTIQTASRGQRQEVLVNFSLAVSFVTFLGIFVYHLTRRLYEIEKIKKKTDKVVVKLKKRFVDTKLRLQGKYNEEMANERGFDGDSASTQQGIQYLNKPNAPIGGSGTPTSSHISLHDMVPAPDDKHMSSCELREPVLDFLSVPKTLRDRQTT